MPPKTSILATSAKPSNTARWIDPTGHSHIPRISGKIFRPILLPHLPATYLKCSIDLGLAAVLPISALHWVYFAPGSQPRMAEDPKHLEVTLETQVESVNLAEEMCLRVAEAAGFGEDDCYKIGMSVREGVINAFHYG